MYNLLINWLYGLPGWQILAIFVVLLISTIPILVTLFRWIWEKLPTFSKNEKKITYVDPFWGMERAAASFFQALHAKSGRGRSAEVDPLYLVLTENPDNFSDKLSKVGIENKLKKSWSSGNVRWSSYVGGCFAIASRKLWDNEDKFLTSLVKLMIKNRPERPIDGVIVDIDASQLLGGREESFEEFLQTNSRLRNKLLAVQNQSQMNFPTYIIFSNCEKIKGFSLLKHYLTAEDLGKVMGIVDSTGSNVTASIDAIDADFKCIVENMNFMATKAIFDPDQDDAVKEKIFAFGCELEKFLQNAKRVLFEIYPFNSSEFVGDLRCVALLGSDSNRVKKNETQLFSKELFQSVIFPEANRARPVDSALRTMTANVMAAKNRLYWVSGAALLLLFTQLWGISSLLISSSENAKIAKSEFFEFLKFKEREDWFEAIYKKKHSSYLEALAAFDPRDIRSIFVPSSYLSNTFNKIQTAKGILDKELLLVPIGHAIQEKVTMASGLETSSQSTSANIQGLSYPNFDPVNKKLSEIESIEETLGVYDQLRLGNVDANSIDNILLTLFNTQAPPGYLPTAINEDNGNVYLGLPVLEAKVFARLGERFETELDTYIFDLIDRDSLISKSSRMALLLTGDTGRFSLGKNGLSKVIEIKTLLSEINELLSSSRYDWVVSNEKLFPAELQSIIARMDANNLLEVSIGQEFERKLFSARSRFISDLKNIVLPNGELLFEFGEEQVSLTSLASDTLNFLNQALRLKGMQQSTLGFSGGENLDFSILLEREEEYFRIWDTRVLNELLEQLKELHRISFSSAPVVPLKKVLEQTLSANAREIFFELYPAAFTYVRIPVGENTDLIENYTSVFNSSYKQLQQISYLMREFEHIDVAETLTDELHEQALFNVNLAYRYLDENRHYDYFKESLNNWDGSVDVRKVLFGEREDIEFQIFLARQLDSLVNTIINRSGPSIALVAESGEFNKLEKPGELIKVLNTYGTLKSYSMGEPATSIELLHNFITRDLKKVSLRACDFNPNVYVALKEDFFVSKLINMMIEIESFCNRVTIQSLEGKYIQFANYFNENIANRFPFTSGTNYNEIFISDLEELKSIFRELERDGLDLWTFSVPNQNEIYTFLNKLDSAITFFDRVSVSEEKASTPIINMRVRFRTHREMERASKHISLWELNSGDNIITHVDEMDTISWNYSDSISLKLKWAENSIVKPAKGYNDGYFLRTKDGNTVIQIDGRWSLLKFIYTYHNHSVCDFGKYCLEITSPINFVSASNAKLNGGIFRGFIDIELLDKEGVISYPDFPNKAPMIKKY